MDTREHRRLGVAAALIAAHLHPMPPAGIAVMTAVAWACAGGAASPDLDNQPDAHTIDKTLPDELLGGHGPLGHRQLAHWAGWPVAGWWLWHVAPIVTPSWPIGVAFGVWVAWTSHLGADFVWGRPNQRAGMGRGIPFLGWVGHVGIGLNPHAWHARLAGWAALLLAAYATATLAAPLATYWP